MDVVELCVQGSWLSLVRTVNVQPTPFSTVLANSLRRDFGQKVAVDAGAGGGIQSITLARLGFERVIAIEIADEACEVLEANVRRHGLTDCVQIINADIDSCGEIDGVDLVVSNPPTIPEHEDLPGFVGGAGSDGMKFIRELSSMAPRWLAGDGSMQFVLSSLLAFADVQDEMADHGLELRGLASFLLPFRRFYFDVWHGAELMDLATEGRVAVEGTEGELEFSELLTVYRAFTPEGGRVTRTARPALTARRSTD